MRGLVWVRVALLALWAMLWLVFKVVGGFVHVLVFVAIVMIVWGLVKRGASAVQSGP